MYYIGLMSGTSADGIDAALVEFSPDSTLSITATQHTPYPADTLQDLVVLSEADKGDFPKIDELDLKLGLLFGDAVNNLLASASKEKAEIVAIGSHGHTVRHEPNAKNPTACRSAGLQPLLMKLVLRLWQIFAAVILLSAAKVRPWCPHFIRQYSAQIKPIDVSAILAALPTSPIYLPYTANRF